MSQIVTRAGAVGDDKEKRTDSPVRDMKKKIAANAEKEKMAAEKQTDKPAEKKEKPVEKQNGDKPAEKKDKPAEKSSEKKDKEDDKSDKRKSTEKVAEKKNEQEKPKEDNSKAEKSKKTDTKADDKPKAGEKAKQNGVSEVQNGTGEATNGTTVCGDSDDELQIVDEFNDELFPELKYDDASDTDFEGATPEALSRSMTRRSQSKETKLLKLKDDVPSATDRKLRSTDSPKKSTEKPQDSPKKSQQKSREQSQEKGESPSVAKNDAEKAKENGERHLEAIVVIEDCEVSQGESRKPDTNYSKSRVKVSPYRRSMRLADNTNTSIMANYTGNNTTMEMDISEASVLESEADGSCVGSLRGIRGRRSYRTLPDYSPRLMELRAQRAQAAAAADQSTRPTGTVVGRKRKPEASPPPSVPSAHSVQESIDVVGGGEVCKRRRLLERVMSPLRRALPSSTPLPRRRAAPIVGINTDLPLSVPVVPTEQFDPETMKPSEITEKTDPRRCTIM